MLSLVYDLTLVATGFFAGDYIRRTFPGVYTDMLTTGYNAYVKVKAYVIKKK